MLRDSKLQNRGIMENSEIILPLPSGGTLRCGLGENFQHGGFLLICDADGNEIVMWDSQEWADEPESVIGAVMRAAATPIPELLERLNLTEIVDGCWVTE